MDQPGMSRLHAVEQSTLSRCIRQLKERIQMIVFERSSCGVGATLAGREFLRAARSILEQMDMLVTTAHRTGRGEAGRPAHNRFLHFAFEWSESCAVRDGLCGGLAKPHPIGNTLAVAGYLEISTESLAHARGAGSLQGPALWVPAALVAA